VFAINWGDAPTWLAVAVASVGGWVALRQLRDQQNVIRRQTIQLERQQAEQIGFSWQSAEQINETVDEHIWMGIVRNDSRRPIRDVICRIQPGPGQGFDLEAQGVAEIVDVGVGSNMSAPVSLAPKLDRMVPLIRAGSKFGFKTSVSVKDHGNARMMVRFTDDAGLHWEVDPDLHLAKMDSRSW
jgi:hypothetical protein